MTGKATPADVPAGEVPAGGMWDRQRVFGGLRMQQEFTAQEQFILWGITAGGEVPLDGTDSAPKTVLTVSRMNEPKEKFEVNTLSGPIAEMVTLAQDDDFPVIAYWETVPTKREQSEATVLTALGKYEA
jgi:hypothetical protein